MLLMMIKEGDAVDGNLNKTAPNISQGERSQQHTHTHRLAEN